MRPARRSIRFLHLLLCLGLWLALVAPLPAVAAGPPAGGPASPPMSARPASVPAAGPGGAPGWAAGSDLTAGTELAARRTANSRTYALGRGVYRTVYAAGAVNYRDASGAWQPIDNGLVPDTLAGYAATNRANAYRVDLPTSLAAPVRVAVGGAAVAFALQGAGGTASVAGSVARYAGAYPGVTVVATAASSAVTEDLTLASAAAPATFVYALTTTGVTARPTAGGGVAFVDGAGKTAFAFAPPAMVDAAHRVSGAVRLALGQGAAGQTLTLAADPAWLAAPGRSYPVMIDPALIVTAGDSADCNLDSASPTTSYCSLSYLTAGANGGEIARSLVQFGVVPSADVVVLGAEVGLFQLAAGNDTPATLELHQVTRGWTTGATWDTADGTTAWTTPGGDFAATPATTVADAGNGLDGTMLRFTPTALVAGWADGSRAVDGLLLKTANEQVTQYFYFCPGGGRGAANGCTAADEPYLSIVYTAQIGDRGFFPLQTTALSDRMALSVNLANGNLMLTARDLAVAGTGLDLALDRRYQSQDVSGGMDFGNQWMSSAGIDDWMGYMSGDGSCFIAIGGSYYVPFAKDANGNFVSPPGVDADLVQQQDGTMRLTWHATGVREYFTARSGLYSALTAIVDKNGNTISLGYSPYSVTDTQGRRLTTVVNAQNFVTQLTDSAGRLYQYAYDGSNNLVQYTDPAGKLTKYGYDSSGNLTKITDPLNQVTTIAYDGSHRATSVTFGAGSPVAATWGYRYDTSGGPSVTVTTVTDPNGHQTVTTTDIAGRVTKVTDALGNSQQWTWTADDHVQTSTDAYGKVTQYGYDSNNNLNQVTLPTGATTSAVYGTVANIPSFFVPTSTTDAQGHTTTYGYDGNGNVKTVTDQLPSQNQTQYFYNANGTVDHVIDARGNTTSYQYDSHGNLTKIVPPSPMGSTTIVPDGLSRVQSVTDGKGQQRTYSYDAMDRVTAIQYPSYGAGNVSYLPDADGNLTSMTDSAGTTSYQYDAQNRQTTKTLPASLGGGTFGYGYDGASNLTTFTDTASIPGQTLSVIYGYDSADRVKTLVENGKTTSFGYNDNDQRTSTTYPDGVVMSQGYDASQRLTSIAGTSGSTTLSSFTYSYAKGSTDTMLFQSYQETLAAPNGGPTAQVNGAMTYDVLNRLSKWLVTKQADGSVVHDYTYQYDGNSNRTQVIADPQNSSGQIVSDPSQGVAHSNESDLSFNAPNEISSIQPYGSQGQTLMPVTYGYDTAGNQTGNNGGGTGKPLTIAYLPTNQTQSISDVNQNQETMTWSGAGQSERTKRTWTDQGTNYQATYTWSLLGLSGYSNNGIAEPTATTSVTSWLIRDPSGTPIAQRYSNGTEEYYLFDGQGNVVGLEDPGTMQAAYDYCPTGNEADLASTQMTSVGLANPLRQGAASYDDLTKDYFGADGTIREDYSGTGTQGPGRRYGDATGVIPEHMPNAGGGGLAPPLLAEDEDCANSNPEESTADQEGCNVSEDTSGSASASVGGGGGEGGGGGGRNVVTGFTRHGMNQTINRGVRPYEILDAVRNPIRVVQRAGGIVQYIGRWADIRVSEAGRVVTAIRFKPPWAP